MAISPSQQILRLSSHGHNNNPVPDIDIPAAQRLVQEEIALNQNPIADVFDDPQANPVLNHVDEMDVDEHPHPRSPSHPPAQIIAGERHAGGQNIRGRAAREVHPNNAHLLWCTNNRHWVHRDIFGDLGQCENCRRRAHENRHRGRERQSETILQTELDAQIEPQPLLPPPPQPLPQYPPQPPPVPPLVDPLTGSAVTPEERTLLLSVREKLMAIKRELCVECHENWFDLDIRQGVCAKCRKNCKYKESNQMYPGLRPELPTLTQMEEMLIASVHALVQLWQV
jgi:hypothetical protein